MCVIYRVALPPSLTVVPVIRVLLRNSYCVNVSSR